MTVRELIDFLKTMPQDVTVVQEAFSDYVPLAADNHLGLPFIDDVVQHEDGRLERYFASQYREPPKGIIKVLVFPGN